MLWHLLQAADRTLVLSCQQSMPVVAVPPSLDCLKCFDVLCSHYAVYQCVRTVIVLYITLTHVTCCSLVVHRRMGGVEPRGTANRGLLNGDHEA